MSVPQAPSDRPIEVILCDDQALVRQGLRLILEDEPSIHVAGEAANGESCLLLVASVHPDVVLMDLRMSGIDGVQATKQICERFPSVRVLVLTTYSDDALVRAALSAGAAGYLLKDAQTEDIFAAIRTVARGGVWIQTPGAVQLLSQLAQESTHRLPKGQNPATPLTPRELEITTLIARGLNNREIADHLLISEATVKTHINNIFAKLELSDRAQLVSYAFRHHLLPR